MWHPWLQHLLTTDAISWSVLACIRLTEEDTTSSSRIFIKILFQDLSENLGLMSLNQRLQEPTLQMFFGGIFPKVPPSLWLLAHWRASPLQELALLDFVTLN